MLASCELKMACNSNAGGLDVHEWSYTCADALMRLYGITHELARAERSRSCCSCKCEVRGTCA